MNFNGVYRWVKNGRSADHPRALLAWLAAAGCGFFSWGWGFTPLATFSVLLWHLSRTRLQAWATMAAYYIGASHTIPGASLVFFEGKKDGVYGVLLWIGSAALLALPWAAFAPTEGRWKAVARLAFAITAVSVPPLGLIGWTNPLLGAALVVPGLGWVSLAIGLLLLASGVFINAGRGTGRRIAIALGLCVCAGVTHKLAPPPPAPSGWFGATIHAGRPPETAREQRERQTQILAAIDDGLQAGQKAIVLPEQILGTWSPTWRYFIEATVGEQLRETGAVIVLGAAVPTGEQARTYNAALVFDGINWRAAYARFAIPVAMWKPWRNDSTDVQWSGSGVYEIAGQRVAVSLCYEDVMMWPALWAFTDTPEVIVSLASAWWATASPQVIDVQREHIEAWARIFRLPLVRALNAP